MSNYIEGLKQTRQENVAKGEALVAGAEKRGAHNLSAAEQAEFDELMSHIETIDERLADAATQEKRAKEADDAFAAIGGRSGDSKHESRGLEYDTARRSIDAAFRSGDLHSEGAEKATELLGVGTSQERSLAARWAIAAGHRDYLGAFTKLCADPAQGHLMWTPEEGQAFRNARAVQADLRAMSLTDANGGYMVPLTLDPAVILTSAGSINPMRQVSRVVQTTTDSWTGINSAGATAEWIAEATQVADGSPSLDDQPIPVHKGDSFVPFSFEVGDDATNFVAELRKLLVDAADQLQATAFVTGSGSGQPTGIITALAGGSSVVAPTVAESFTAADVYKVLEAVPPRFRANAQWMANLSILDAIDQFETTNGAKKFPQAGENPAVILRRQAFENSNLDGTYDAAATAANHVLLCGDFSNYVIVDRIGTTLELIPHLFGANGRPTLQRGALLWFRTGADSVNDNAFRVLNVATTA